MRKWPSGVPVCRYGTNGNNAVVALVDVPSEGFAEFYYVDGRYWEWDTTWMTALIWLDPLNDDAREMIAIAKRGRK